MKLHVMESSCVLVCNGIAVSIKEVLHSSEKLWEMPFVVLYSNAVTKSLPSSSLGASIRLNILRCSICSDIHRIFPLRAHMSSSNSRAALSSIYHTIQV